MLDDGGRAFRSVVGILTEFFPRPPLTQKIPDPVELHVDLVEPAPIVGIQTRTFVEERVLFGDERFDVLVQLLVVHATSLPANAACQPSRPPSPPATGPARARGFRLRPDGRERKTDRARRSRRRPIRRSSRC